MSFPVLKSTHVMLGCDMHPALFGLIPVPLLPHVVGAPLSEGIWGEEEKTNHDVRSEGAKTLAKGHDVGAVIPHVAPLHLLLPVWLATSSSKSLFAASSVRTPKGPLALYTAIPNLNCCAPLDLPGGVVMATNTHSAGMTLGDFVMGFASMAAEMAVSWLAGKMGQGLSKILEPIGERIACTLVRSARWSTALFGHTPLTLQFPASMVVDTLIGGHQGREAVETILEPFVTEFTKRPMDEFVEWADEELDRSIYEAPAPEYPRHPPEP